MLLHLIRLSIDTTTYDQIKKWTQSYPRLDSAKVMVEMTPSIVELKVISLLMIMVIVMVMGEMT